MLFLCAAFLHRWVELLFWILNYILAGGPNGSSAKKLLGRPILGSRNTAVAHPGTALRVAPAALDFQGTVANQDGGVSIRLRPEPQWW